MMALGVSVLIVTLSMTCAIASEAVVLDQPLLNALGHGWILHVCGNA